MVLNRGLKFSRNNALLPIENALNHFERYLALNRKVKHRSYYSIFLGSTTHFNLESENFKLQIAEKVSG